MLATGIVVAWIAPVLALGLATAAQALTTSTPPPEPAEEPTAELTWEQIDLAEDQDLPPVQRPPVAPPTPVDAKNPTTVQEPAATGPLRLRLAPGLFATTATARCPDGSQHRAPFVNGLATLTDLPTQDVCRVTFQGGLVTSLRSGAGDLSCTLAATTGSVICR